MATNGIARLLRREVKRRELAVYPTGKYRLFLLFVVVLANIVASYEGNLAPIVPLLIKELGITSLIYGQLNAITLLFTAIVVLFIGPYADRFGRSLFVVSGILVTAIFIFVMTGIDTVAEFLIVKIILGITDAVALGPVAGLVRDFSPQMSRGIAFAFWSMGPVGGPFIANGVAAVTLPMFGTWQSQLYIMGSICLLLWVVVFLFLRDLSPELRGRVVTHESEAHAQVQPEQSTDPAGLPEEKITLRRALKIPLVWLQPLGMALFLLIYFTMLVYGPLFFSETYKVDEAIAARLTMFFWVGTFIGLIGSGWLSDRLRLRKIVTTTGALVAAIFNPIWILYGMTPETSQNLVALCSFLAGVTGACAYSSWMAMYSENLEQIDPRIQATGWGVFGFAMRAMILLVAFFSPMVAKMAGGWQAWFWLAEVGMILYLIFPFLAYGPWFSAEKGAATPPSVKPST